MDINEIQEQIKQVKHELVLYQKIAEALGFSKKDTEAQINKYLETLNTLPDMEKRLKN